MRGKFESKDDQFIGGKSTQMSCRRYQEYFCFHLIKEGLIKRLVGHYLIITCMVTLRWPIAVRGTTKVKKKNKIQ